MNKDIGERTTVLTIVTMNNASYCWEFFAASASLCARLAILSAFNFAISSRMPLWSFGMFYIWHIKPETNGRGNNAKPELSDPL